MAKLSFNTFASCKETLPSYSQDAKALNVSFTMGLPGLFFIPKCIPSFIEFSLIFSLLKKVSYHTTHFSISNVGKKAMPFKVNLGVFAKRKQILTVKK